MENWKEIGDRAYTWDVTTQEYFTSSEVQLSRKLGLFKKNDFFINTEEMIVKEFIKLLEKIYNSCCTLFIHRHKTLVEFPLETKKSI